MDERRLKSLSFDSFYIMKIWKERKVCIITYPFSGLAETPLASRLVRVGAAETIRNFHALPLAGALRNMPAAWAERFSLVCDRLSATDVSFATPAIDSLFAPEGPLAHAQELAAETFGAQVAFFGSCGTTISNRIVLDALGGRGSRVLLDGASHQSLLFTAKALGFEATIIEPLRIKGSAIPNISRIETTAREAAAAGHLLT